MTTATTVDLRHLPMVKYHRATDSYVAECPGCEWAAAPSLNTAALHAASREHYEETTPAARRLESAHKSKTRAADAEDMDYRLSSI